MRLYLSSFKIGEHFDSLSSMYGDSQIGYVANALDHVSDCTWLENWIKSDIEQLTSLGLRTRRLDLRDFFASDMEIGPVISELGGIWISGGNVFVLRQAMKLSGLDAWLLSARVPEGFVYGGYSAACCVLAPSLNAYAIVDDPSVHPYEQNAKTIWDGLGLLDFAFMPHFQSQHPESRLIDQEIAYCEEHGIAYRTFRDGEVLIL
jgi:dipeptidase E